VLDEIDLSDRNEDSSENQRRIADVFASPNRGLRAMRAHEAAEVLLVAAWFRGRPEEIARTSPPKAWSSSSAATLVTS
jgi:hypothetical protein